MYRTKCSRPRSVPAAERAIPCRGAHSQSDWLPAQSVALVKADEPQFSLCSPAPTLTSFPRAEADTFLPPSSAEVRAVRPNRHVYAEIYPAFGRSPLRPICRDEPAWYATRAKVAPHALPMASPLRIFFDIKICPDNLFRRISFPVSRLLCALRCRHPRVSILIRRVRSCRQLFALQSISAIRPFGSRGDRAWLVRPGTKSSSSSTMRDSSGCHYPMMNR